MNPKEELELARENYENLKRKYNQFKDEQTKATIIHINEKKAAIKKKVIASYDQTATPYDQCNCEKGEDYSTKCLEHLCSCHLEKEYPGKKYEKHVCDYHTNVLFKNKGCFWCRHSDCGRWYC